MSRNGLKLLRYCLKLTNKQRRGKVLFVYIQPERRRREGLQQKKETLNHPPYFYGSIFFCVLFFSFCSNLSVWPGRQVVPNGSLCYTPIFDGLVIFDCKGSLRWKPPPHPQLEERRHIGIKEIIDNKYLSCLIFVQELVILLSRSLKMEKVNFVLSFPAWNFTRW